MRLQAQAHAVAGTATCGCRHSYMRLQAARLLLELVGHVALYELLAVLALEVVGAPLHLPQGG
jgi:hypothetical protein